MILREILQIMKEKNAPILLCNHKGEFEASELLENLSEPMLKTAAHFQPGMYIAAINEGGYLGEVLFKVKSKEAHA
ncbi:MAG: hypothetical protein JXB26_00825 [Candidatus Aminicenantes bacterium]|nr:hypothetical protein [Candidatus Aminicenantes bacterium]